MEGKLMKYVAVDIETNHLDFTKGDIKLISLYTQFKGSKS